MNNSNNNDDDDDNDNAQQFQFKAGGFVVKNSVRKFRHTNTFPYKKHRKRKIILFAFFLKVSYIFILAIYGIPIPLKSQRSKYY